MRSFGAWLAAALTPTVAVASFLCLVAPRLTVAALAVFALVILSLALIEGARLRALIKPDIGLWLFLATGVYCLINATWSEDVGRASNKAVIFLLFAALSIGTVRAVLAWPEDRAKRVAWGFTIGVSLGALYLLVEVLTGQVLVRGLFNLLPLLQPGDFKGMKVDDGEIVAIRLAELNRGIALLLMSLWPLLLCLTRAGRDLQAWIFGGGVFAAAALIILASEHNTSQMAIFVALIVFVAAYFLPRAAFLGVAVGWCLSFVVVVPLAIAAYHADLHHAKWLPYSAQARIVLWSYTAHAVSDAPLLGIGGSSARAMAAEPEAIQKAKEAKAEGKAYAWQAGPHAHNQYLQTWYELGVVGVVLALAAGAWVLWIIGRLPAAQLPYMLAHFAAFAALSASAWGMWQTWLMALPGLAAIYGAIAVAATRKAA